ncbi:nucleoside-diphosphate sugar epimerase/dehydratase [Jannaschia sp. LMIT008]|uniref:polysaccharide biosynthesis protein n=1 Tax=Jannaschia maritima TaxID=3032585 RepID=UPI0028110744|nr:nucleoside-diphosphate sugar epimerase/dehydratase [Jannaschia sp. LMIT008]
MLADVVLLTICFVVAMVLRQESFAFFRDRDVWLTFLPAMIISLAVFIRFGFYHAVVRYISSTASGVIFGGIVASAAALALANWSMGFPLPVTVPVVYGLVALFVIGGSRLTMRSVLSRGNAAARTGVVIYGAGVAGKEVLGSLRASPEYRAIAFVDDDPAVQNIRMSELRVHAPDALPDLIERYGAQLVLLAMPGTSRRRKRDILARLESLPVEVKTIPSMRDLVDGTAEMGDIRDVPIEDLLGRDPVPPDADLMAADIAGRRVMITGAGGSIGSELCRQALRQDPSCLVLLDQSEFALYTIERELAALNAARDVPVRVVPVLGSVQHPQRTVATLKRHGIQTVYHAAAYKHVPMVEENVIEAVRNNVFGTLNLARAAVEAGVEAFILISTDKAVRPTNVMGATKRLAELICQAHDLRQDGTLFSSVRFGNVLGSSGSVIPVFREQIASGGPITVTDPEITRYFMTIPEAAQLVIQAGAMARGGDVFVLDMGESVRIVDMARRMVRLAGLEPWIRGQDPEGDVEITFTGLRKGEKLYEELLIADATAETAHPRIMTATERMMGWPELSRVLDALWIAMEAGHDEPIRTLLQAAPLEYRPEVERRAA